MALLRDGYRLQLVIVVALIFLHRSMAVRKQLMHWVLEISDGPTEANRIAEKYGLINLGQVGCECLAKSLVMALQH